MVENVSPYGITVGDCGNSGKKNGAIECSNIGAHKGTHNAVKL